MTLPKNLFNKYLARFDELIQEGQTIYQVIKDIPEIYVSTSNSRTRPWTEKEVESHSKLHEWRTKYISLLDKVIPSSSIHRRIIEDNQITNSKSYLGRNLSKLKALREDFEKGFLEDLTLQIEAEITSDYMSQAEQLLAEGQSGKYDHVPAAVLSGAVLEKTLKTLCGKQTPPISTVNSKGEPLTLNPLIDALKKASIFNELKAKQLRVWAAIRNKAAHGEFDQFTRHDVELMIRGIEDFLAAYMA